MMVIFCAQMLDFCRASHIVQYKITTCFYWGFIDNLIILSFLMSDLSLAIAYCTQIIISVVNFKVLNFQRFRKLYEDDFSWLYFCGIV